MQNHTLASTVHHVIDASGVTHSKNEDIAYQFQCFYSNLYNLRANKSGTLMANTRADLIQDFLCQYSPCAPSEGDFKALEALLSMEEWEKALKTTIPGKSQGS